MHGVQSFVFMLIIKTDICYDIAGILTCN